MPGLRNSVFSAGDESPQFPRRQPHQFFLQRHTFDLGRDLVSNRSHHGNRVRLLLGFTHGNTSRGAPISSAGPHIDRDHPLGNVGFREFSSFGIEPESPDVGLRHGGKMTVCRVFRHPSTETVPHCPAHLHGDAQLRDHRNARLVPVSSEPGAGRIREERRCIGLLSQLKALLEFSTNCCGVARA